MRIKDNGNGCIEVEGTKRDDVIFVMVDYVFFERHGEKFVNTTNDNINGYNVEILPTNNLNLELKISTVTGKGSGTVFVEDKNCEHSKITMQFAKNKMEECNMGENIVGGYKVHKKVGKKELAIFEYAMKDHLGVDYKPEIVASQVVNGMNYLYVCTGKIVYPGAETKIYLVKIYTKFQHSIAPEVRIEEIKECPVTTLLDILEEKE